MSVEGGAGASRQWKPVCLEAQVLHEVAAHLVVLIAEPTSAT